MVDVDMQIVSCWIIMVSSYVELTEDESILKEVFLVIYFYLYMEVD